MLAVKRAELLDVSTQYWYNEEPGETVIDDLSEIMAGVLLNLTGAGIGVIPSGPEHGLALINNVSGSQYQALETFITNSFNGIDLETSGAHLVYMFFDNRMVLDPTKSGRIAVGDANTLGQITQQSLLMPSDGFFYVYTTTLSARSYYFDKLKIKRWKPQVRVSYDYYPYGMTWNNPDLQDEENRLHDHTYQDKEFLFGEYDGTVGLALYDFHARMYDPATGRWLVPDPAAQFANPYLAMGNNPVIGVDPDGRITDFFQDEEGNIIWNDSQQSTIELNDVLYTNIGDELVIEMISRIENPNTLPLPLPLVNLTEGDKLTVITTLKGNYDENGSFSHFSSSSEVYIGSSFHLIPGETASGFEIEISKGADGSWLGGYNYTTRVNDIEKPFINVVDVNQNVWYYIGPQGDFHLGISHGTFPSVLANLNDENAYVFYQHDYLLSQTGEGTNSATSTMLEFKSYHFNLEAVKNYAPYIQWNGYSTGKDYLDNYLYFPK